MLWKKKYFGLRWFIFLLLKILRKELKNRYKASGTLQISQHRFYSTKCDITWLSNSKSLICQINDFVEYQQNLLSFLLSVIQRLLPNFHLEIVCMTGYLFFETITNWIFIWILFKNINFNISITVIASNNTDVDVSAHSQHCTIQDPASVDNKYNKLFCACLLKFAGLNCFVD